MYTLYGETFEYIPHLFSDQWPIFTVYGPKQSIPAEKKGGLSVRRRAAGKSDILGMVGFALHF